MKYVRTKDGAILEKDSVLHNVSKGFGVRDIKQADIIEELCDEFVEVLQIANQDKFEEYLKDVEPYVFDIALTKRDMINFIKHPHNKTIEEYFEHYKDLENIYNNSVKVREKIGIKCDLYGAIWTDKGLIYVAKMNEKGELELL